MKYKVGDIVKVREDLKVGASDSAVFVTVDMAEFAGKLVTIDSIDGEYYHIEEDDLGYYWVDDFFENDDEDCCVDNDEEACCVNTEREEKSDEYEYVIENVLSEMSEKTKDILIKELIKGENNITIVAVPVYEVVCRRNGVSIQQVVGTKYSVTVTTKDGTVVL